MTARATAASLVCLACFVCACPRATPAATDAAAPAPSPPAPSAAAPLDGARVLAMLSEHAPSVEVSMQTRGAELVLDLRGPGAPPAALALLASLPERLPGTRVVRLQLDASAWSAALVTAGAPALERDALPSVLAAARPVFTGETALLRSGVVDVTAAGISFTGALAPDRSIADAGDVIARGFTLAKVAAGPPFVLELTHAVAVGDR